MSEAKCSTDQRVADALAYDPLAEAERATGKDYKVSEETTALGMLLAMSHNQHKKELLASRDDTYFSQPFPEWRACVERMGFEVILDDPIEGTGDRFYCWWRRDGLLLKCDTYFDGKSVNSAGVCGNFRGPRSALNGSNGYISDVDGVPVWEWSKDAREGLRHNLSVMEANGQHLSVWLKHPFLWLLSYADSKVDGYDYQAITESRIDRFPEHVRSAIRGK